MSAAPLVISAVKCFAVSIPTAHQLWNQCLVKVEAVHGSGKVHSTVSKLHSLWSWPKFRASFKNLKYRDLSSQTAGVQRANSAPTPFSGPGTCVGARGYRSVIIMV
jgi:hypothetical protein